MKILYLHQHFSTTAGAVGNRSYQMARALVEAGHQVTMVCGRCDKGHTGLSGPFRKGIREGSVEGIHVVECDLFYSNEQGFAERSWQFLRFMWRTIKVVLTHDYDCLFATTTPLTVGVPGVLGRHLRRKPFVFEVRDLWPEIPAAMGIIRNPVTLALLSALEFVSYRSAHRCIGLSPGIVEGIARRGVPRERIAMIPNGCDLDVFAASHSGRAASDSPRVLVATYCGTHGAANALSNVLDGAAQLKAANRTDIVIQLIGSGAEKSALMKRAHLEGLDNVRFVDPVPKTQLAEMLAETDIGLQCLANLPAFYYGTSPNKFFDYLSAGLPVLCNYPGWVAQMIEENDCGFVVPPADPVAFAAALINAADNRDRLPDMAANAARLGRDQFDRRDLAAQWVEWVVGAPYSVRK